VSLIAAATDPVALIAVVSVVVVLAMNLMLIAVIVKYYKRCPPNRILVIYGKAGRGEAALCMNGGARLVVPLLQDYAWLALEPMRIEVSRQTTASGKTIADPLPRVFSVAIGTTPELMQAAAVRLLNLPSDQIMQQAEDIIVTRLDVLIDAIERGQLHPGTEEYYQRLEDSITTELETLGLVLINFRRE